MSLRIEVEAAVAVAVAEEVEVVATTTIITVTTTTTVATAATTTVGAAEEVAEAVDVVVSETEADELAEVGITILALPMPTLVRLAEAEVVADKLPPPPDEQLNDLQGNRPVDMAYIEDAKLAIDYGPLPGRHHHPLFGSSAKHGHSDRPRMPKMVQWV